jgi:hypothetical protein
MPKIIIQANQSNADAGRAILTERIVATHLQDDHYAAQLIERLTWATIDAERLGCPTTANTATSAATCDRADRRATPSPAAHAPRGRRGASSANMTPRRPTGVSSRGLDRRRSLTGPDATGVARGERDHERADARWLYAWSYNALRPTGELLARRVTTPALLQPGRRLGCHLAGQATPAEFALSAYPISAGVSFPARRSRPR